MKGNKFFFKAIPYALLLAGATFMALVSLALTISSVWIAVSAGLFLVASLFLAHQTGVRLALTKDQ